MKYARVSDETFVTSKGYPGIEAKIEDCYIDKVDICIRESEFYPYEPEYLIYDPNDHSAPFDVWRRIFY